MGIEIERKYLVDRAKWRSQKETLKPSETGEKYCQGYIPTTNGTTVRLRTVGDRGYLTIKSKTTGYSRAEFEYPIPLQDAEQMLHSLCMQPLIEKIRYKISYRDFIWEVDEFFGENQGLIIAEVELDNEAQKIELPDWIDREVRDKKYFNASLIKYPYSQWKDE